MRRDGCSSSLVECAAVITAAVAAWLLIARAGADTTADDLMQHAPTSDYLRRGDLLVSYDGRTRCPRWVLERVTRESLAGDVTRDAHAVYRDPEIPSEFAVDPRDFRNTGYDLGHLSPAADHPTTREAMQAAFSTTNIAPQSPRLNRGPWRHLEELIRALAGDGSTAYVVTVPLWLPTQTRQDGRGETRHVIVVEAFGASRVWVPTHWAKSALVQRPDGRREVHSWIAVNDQREQTINDWHVTTDELESAAGLDFWRGLPSDEQRRLEAAR